MCLLLRLNEFDVRVAKTASVYALPGQPPIGCLRVQRFLPANLMLLFVFFHTFI